MSDKPQYIYVTYISTTPEKVWNALQDPELTKLFWGRGRNVSDWQVGSDWQHQDYDDASAVRVTGKVVEADPPKRLVVTWESRSAAPEPRKASRVTYAIEPAFGAVRLTVTHDELELGSKAWQDIAMGWPAVLSSLKSLLETGQPLAMTTRSWGK